MDLRTKCEIIVKQVNANENFYSYEESYTVDATLRNICKDVENWIDNETLKTYFEPIINKHIDVEYYENLTKPLSEREWAVVYDNRGVAPKRDIIYLRGQIGADYYVYVHGEVEGAYGKQFEVAVDGSSDLHLLPTIKQFTDELKVGKCFIVEFEKVIEFGNNRKKYCYNITEISEEDYLAGVVDARLRHHAW